jgi:hypothetical protein
MLTINTDLEMVWVISRTPTIIWCFIITLMEYKVHLDRNKSMLKRFIDIYFLPIVVNVDRSIANTKHSVLHNYSLTAQCNLEITCRVNKTSEMCWKYKTRLFYLRFFSLASVAQLKIHIVTFSEYMCYIFTRYVAWQ